MINRLNAQFKNVFQTADRFMEDNKQHYLNKSGGFLKSAGKAVLMVGLCFVMLYPMLFILSASFKTLDDLYNPSVVWLPRSFNMEAMKIALALMKYSESVLKTLTIMIPSVLFQLVAVLMTGYGFARFKFWGKNLLFGFLIFTIIVPVQSYIIPLYVNLKNFNFFGVGSLIGLVSGQAVTTNLLDTNTLFYLQAILGMGIRSGLCIFIIRQFFKNIPVELEEAATIDGCGPIRTFMRVMIPNALPLIATVVVFSIVWYWNDFYLSSMFFRTDFPLSVNLTTLRTTLSSSDQVVNGVSGISSQELVLMREPILACGCLITVLPLVIFYVFLQRYFTEGVERSGIVG